MGSILNRSWIEDNETYIKIRKDKQIQQHQNFDFIKTYELLNKNFDQQQIMKIDVLTKYETFVLIDPLDASNNYSITENNVGNQPWQFFHDVNNSFYPVKSHQMTPSHNISYNPNEYIHVKVPDMIKNQSQTVMFDEHLPKK
ncbi:unnamed protein product [Rotaria sordida]|uniref:Uncharacterized protein n=1 Tax=Rotaria sordida TaxID=392033 RepID=A0A819S127_9BILA|nr:unnamed protein product [Rotaria sordida]CAF4055534.1 unnamed protein product [Rotaria sordida]